MEFSRIVQENSVACSMEDGCGVKIRIQWLFFMTFKLELACNSTERLETSLETCLWHESSW